MTMKDDVFDEAHKDCLKLCFSVLTMNLVVGTPDDAEAKFKNCCDNCRKARDVARKAVGSFAAKAADGPTG
jgi:hypothetical protein